jgi:hypothetical protein
MAPPSSELATDAAREFGVRSLGLDQVPCLIETFACLEQVRRQIGPVDIDAEAFDHATTLDDGAPWLPKGTTLACARFGRALSGES